MKKGKIKKLEKKAGKVFRKELEDILAGEIKTAVEKNGFESKKAGKEIKKAASLIAKKLAEKAEFSKPKSEKNEAETGSPAAGTEVKKTATRKNTNTEVVPQAPKKENKTPVSTARKRGPAAEKGTVRTKAASPKVDKAPSDFVEGNTVTPEPAI